MPIVKTNVDGYVKGAGNLIINTKNEELQSYRNQIDKSKKIIVLENNVCNLKEDLRETRNELSEIKTLLLKLIEKNNV